MSTQAFPARYAETLDRMGANRIARPGVSDPRGDLVLVQLGDRTFLARTHGERVTRRGRQTLLSVHGRLTWIASHRVQPLESSAA